MSDEKQSPINEFIDRLSQLEAGDRARLKRNAGNTLEQSRGVHALFFRLLPYGVPRSHEKWYFLVATLYPLADSSSQGNIGHAIRHARANHPEREKGYDRRFEVLLDADDSQLPFRLRQIVRLIKQAEIPVNWSQLLQDLTRWNHVNRFVQERWARAYYAN
jgi:CRISPR type I-E-associated protein CasB/Cse2